SAAASMRSSTSSSRLASAYTSSRSKGVTKVVLIFRTSSWVRTSPACSSSLIDAERAGASEKSKIIVRSSPAESTMWRAWRSKRSKNCSSRGISRNIVGSRLGHAGDAGPGPDPRLPPFDTDRQDREHDDDADDDVDVLVDVGDRLPEQVAGPGQPRHPPDASEDVVEEEPAVLHPADAGDHRRERADDRDEPGEDDGLAPVALVELARADEVPPGEPARLLA